MATPAEDGLFMPAEWSPHARCWMAWPCRIGLWRDELVAAWRVTAQIARTIARFEPVTMLVPPEHLAQATLLCGRSVTMQPMAIDDSWTRDTGPTFLTDANDGAAGVAWAFNGWGNRWSPHANDERMAGAILGSLKMHAYRGPMVLEGGAIAVDGTGTLIATEQCLLNPNRNPTLDRREIEENLALYLGARRIVWLGEGLVGDETDGHVDNLVCFCGSGTVLAATTDDPAEANYAVLRDNLARLKAARGAFGRPLEVIELPHPAPRDWNGKRAPLSYANLYVANGAVILPGFDDPMDGRAADIVQRAFPGREVVQIDAQDLLKGGGGIHCITCPQPVGRALA
jgi:agmatine deiminase